MVDWVNKPKRRFKHRPPSKQKKNTTIDLRQVSNPTFIARINEVQQNVDELLPVGSYVSENQQQIEVNHPHNARVDETIIFHDNQQQSQVAIPSHNTSQSQWEFLCSWA